jgi:Lon protease-like protein
MSSNQADHSLPDGFANVVRLFPLPNLVLFPGVVQALHLFEPRYRELMVDAMATDELITTAFIRPDWASEVDESPEISQTVCIGKILSHTQLEDGRYNLFLVGNKRAKIVKEISTETPYRMAKVEILEEPNDGSSEVSLRLQIVNEFRGLARLRPSWNHEALDQFLDDDLPFSQLVDMICYSCGASPGEQQRVLETVELGERGRIVLELLKAQVLSKQETESAGQDFPPGFSVN